MTDIESVTAKLESLSTLVEDITASMQRVTARVKQYEAMFARAGDGESLLMHLSRAVRAGHAYEIRRWATRCHEAGIAPELILKRILLRPTEGDEPCQSAQNAERG